MSIPILCAAVWIYLLVLRGRFWLARDESAPSGAAPARRIAAVIPARDEAEHVGRAVRSLARQDYEGEIRVFVVDDHSTDGTAEVARAAWPAATIVGAPALPPGWTGKMWAVSQGLAAALEWEPDYVLLTDADVEHAPDNVRSLVSRAERDNLDLASYMVRLENTTIAERFAIPAFVFFFFKLYPPGTARAAGGCMLARSAALKRIGGVDRIRGEIIDDCALAREIRRSGGDLWLGLSAKTRSLRTYGTLAEIGHMIARTAFTQLRYSGWLLAGSVLGMCLVYVAPPVAALSGSVAGAVAWALMAAAYLPMVCFYGQSPLWALTLPATAVFYTGATVWSAVRYWAGRGGSWKGRSQAARERSDSAA